MQALTRETLLEKAKALFANGTVDRAYGWKRGEFDYDVTPRPVPQRAGNGRGLCVRRFLRRKLFQVFS